MTERNALSDLDELTARVVAARDAYHAAKTALHDAKRNGLAIRKCRLCKKQIRSGHKFRFVTVKDCTMLEHRTCRYPDAYSDEQGKRLEKRWGKK